MRPENVTVPLILSLLRYVLSVIKKPQSIASFLL